MDTETGEMIVKRVSVPIGLEELMEGLVKEVLLKKPDDIYIFAAKYFSQLLILRDKGQSKVKTIRSAQSLKDQREKQFNTKIPVSGGKKQLSRQFSVRGESPMKQLASPVISQKPKMYHRNESNSRRRNTGPPTIPENVSNDVGRKKYSRSVSTERKKDSGSNDGLQNNQRRKKSNSRRDGDGITKEPQRNSNSNKTPTTKSDVSGIAKSSEKKNSFEQENKTVQGDKFSSELSTHDKKSILAPPETSKDSSEGLKDENISKTVEGTVKQEYVNEDLAEKLVEKSALNKEIAESTSTEEAINTEGKVESDQSITIEEENNKEQKAKDLGPVAKEESKENQQEADNVTEDRDIHESEENLVAEIVSEKESTENGLKIKAAGTIEAGTETDESKLVGDEAHQPIKPAVTVNKGESGGIDLGIKAEEKIDDRNKGDEIIDKVETVEDIFVSESATVKGESKTTKDRDIESQKPVEALESEVETKAKEESDNESKNDEMSKREIVEDESKNETVDDIFVNGTAIVKDESQTTKDRNTESQKQVVVVDTQTDTKAKEESDIESKTESMGKSEGVEDEGNKKTLEDIFVTAIVKDESKTTNDRNTERQKPLGLVDTEAKIKAKEESSIESKNEEIDKREGVEKEGLRETVGDSIVIESVTVENETKITKNGNKDSQKPVEVVETKAKTEESDIESKNGGTIKSEEDIQKINVKTTTNKEELDENKQKKEVIEEETKEDVSRFKTESVGTIQADNSTDKSEMIEGNKKECQQISEVSGVVIKRENLPENLKTEASFDANKTEVAQKNTNDLKKQAEEDTLSQQTFEKQEEPSQGDPSVSIQDEQKMPDEITDQSSSDASKAVEENQIISINSSHEKDIDSKIADDTSNAVTDISIDEETSAVSSMVEKSKIPSSGEKSASTEHQSSEEMLKTTGASTEDTVKVDAKEKLTRSSEELQSDKEDDSEMKKKAIETDQTESDVEFEKNEQLTNEVKDENSKSREDFLANQPKTEAVEEEIVAKKHSTLGDKSLDHHEEVNETNEPTPSDFTAIDRARENTTTKHEQNKVKSQKEKEENSPNKPEPEEKKINDQEDKETKNISNENDIHKRSKRSLEQAHFSACEEQNEGKRNESKEKQSSEATETTNDDKIERDSEQKDLNDENYKSTSLVEEDVRSDGDKTDESKKQKSIEASEATHEEQIDKDLKQKNLNDEENKSASLDEQDVSSDEKMTEKQCSQSNNDKKDEQDSVNNNTDEEQKVSKSTDDEHMPNIGIIEKVAKNYTNYVIDKKKYMQYDSFDKENNTEEVNTTKENPSDELQNEPDEKTTNKTESQPSFDRFKLREELGLPSRIEEKEVVEPPFDELAKEKLIDSTLSVTKTGLIGQPVKSFINDFISNEKRVSEEHVKPDDPEFEQPKLLQINGLKSNSFDRSKLHEELQKVEQQSKTSSFNPGQLVQKSAEEFESYTGTLAEAAAVLRIQSMWRGFIVRRNFPKPLKILRDENSNVYSKENQVQSLRSEPSSTQKDDDELKFVNAAETIQKFWRGFQVRKHSKSSRESFGINDGPKEEVYGQSKDIATKDESQAASSLDSNDSTSTVIFNSAAKPLLGFVIDQNEPNEVNKLLDEILDYPSIIEEEHLIDDYQNKLLDRISGKEDAHLENVSSKLVERIKAEDAKDIGTVHVSLLTSQKNNDQHHQSLVNNKLERVDEEGPTPIEDDAKGSEKLYTFCSVPAAVSCDGKLVNGLPFSEQVEEFEPEKLSEKNKESESRAKEVEDSKPHLPSTEVPVRSISLDSLDMENQRDEGREKNESQESFEAVTKGATGKEEEKTVHLLHSGEFHDAIIVPLPKQLGKSLETTNNNQKHQSMSSDKSELSSTEQISSLLSNAGLFHSGELHDIVVLPFNLANAGKSTSVDSQATEGEHLESPAGEQTTISDVDNAASVAVRIVQAPEPQTLTSSNAPNVTGANELLRAHAPSPPRSHNQSQLSTLVFEGMESEESGKTKENSMEAQAATKIQAGFRGYQVRKQLKLKNGSSDMNLSKRQCRGIARSDSAKKDPRKPKDLEEKSAVKIQAGIRGFLVRRRQKKQTNQES